MDLHRLLNLGLAVVYPLNCLVRLALETVADEILTVESNIPYVSLVLEVLTNTWKIDKNGNVGLFQKSTWSNTTKLENLRCVNSTGSQDDFFSGLDGSSISTVSWSECHTSGYAIGEEDLRNLGSRKKLIIGAAWANRLPMSCASV
jgi:hypothetical protein